MAPFAKQLSKTRRGKIAKAQSDPKKQGAGKAGAKGGRGGAVGGFGEVWGLANFLKAVGRKPLSIDWPSRAHHSVSAGRRYCAFWPLAARRGRNQFHRFLFSFPNFNIFFLLLLLFHSSPVPLSRPQHFALSSTSTPSPSDVADCED